MHNRYMIISGIVHVHFHTCLFSSKLVCNTNWLNAREKKHMYVRRTVYNMQLIFPIPTRICLKDVCKQNTYAHTQASEHIPPTRIW